MSDKQQRVLWSSLAVIVLALTTIVFFSARNKRVAAAPAKPESEVAAQIIPPEFKQRIRIWIHGDDVRPKVIHASPGKVLLAIENQTRGEVSIQVDRVLPQRVEPLGLLTVPVQRKRWRQELTLAVGEYVFYEVSRPNIRGRLIVEPRHFD